MMSHKANDLTNDHALTFQHQPEVSAGEVNFGQDAELIKGLSADDLMNHSGQFYHYYYLNLLSILGGNRPVEQIRDIAIDSTRSILLGGREFRKSLSKLLELARFSGSGQSADADRALIKLKGWDLDLIKSLLERGRGLILCSHHLGHFRFLPPELALMGFKVSLIVDDISFKESYPSLEYVKRQIQAECAGASESREAIAAPENIRLLNIIKAQEKESFISIIKALERGECIFVYADGNTGWDGIWGSSSKSAIDFLGFPIAVKNGIPRLAAATGAPILPLVTVTNKTGLGKIIFGDPIIPPSSMTPQEKDDFVLQSMKAIYKLLEDHALDFIEQWSSLCFLHRWRTPARRDRATALTPLDIEETERLLKAGKSFKINGSRIAGLNVKDDTVLIDAKTLRIYKAPEEARNLFLYLLQKDGLDSAVISAMNGGFEGRQKIVTLLAHLKKLDVIAAGLESL